MNNSFSFSVPRLFSRETPNNTIPTSITQQHTSQVVVPPIVSQSQTTIPETFNSENRNSSITTTTPSLHGQQCTNNPIREFTALPPSQKVGLVSLYHNATANYVLEDYCFPVSDTFADINQLKCKFNLGCIVAKLKLITLGERQSSISDTVFTTSNVTSKKINYTNMDTRFVRCCNPLCKRPNTKSPKHFHYVCYQHMIANEPIDGTKVLDNEGPSDKILDFIGSSRISNINAIINNIVDSDIKLIYPVCGKRCYNTVVFSKNKKAPKSQSDYANGLNWDQDGNDNKKSSTTILIDWFTTEGNASSYFGGLDADGRTSSDRKEAYHHHIRDEIVKENGESHF